MPDKDTLTLVDMAQLKKVFQSFHDCFAQFAQDITDLDMRIADLEQAMKKSKKKA